MQLANFEGVYDISDDNELGQLELQVQLKPSGAALQFTPEMVATQLRGYLFGLDAHVYADQEEDIDVRVRVDEATRRSLYRMQNAWLVSPAGKFVPLDEIATVRQVTGYSTIRRVDKQRAITVTAETAPGLSPETVTPKLDLQSIREKYPGVILEFTGRQEQQSEAFASLPYGFLAAMAMIYVILAWLFGSYLQPLVVMLVIPFAMIGVVWGHVLLGYDLTFLSLIGFVALSGIVGERLLDSHGLLQRRASQGTRCLRKSSRRRSGTSACDSADHHHDCAWPHAVHARKIISGSIPHSHGYCHSMWLVGCDDTRASGPAVHDAYFR